jgi:hypothetical protein
MTGAPGLSALLRASPIKHRDSGAFDSRREQLDEQKDVPDAVIRHLRVIYVARASDGRSGRQDAYYPLKASRNAAKSAPDAPSGSIGRFMSSV